MTDVKMLTSAELEAGLDEIRRAPKDRGTLELIVRRPQTDAREVLQEGELDQTQGLVGDSWSRRGMPDPDVQLTIMSARAADLVATERSRWPLAGDQLYVDLDLSSDNLPVGTRLTLGSAAVEVTAPPHTGCKKFVSRFGLDAMKFVNSGEGKRLRLRGVNTKVVQPGRIRAGDVVSVIRPD